MNLSATQLEKLPTLASLLLIPFQWHCHAVGRKTGIGATATREKERRYWRGRSENASLLHGEKTQNLQRKKICSMGRPRFCSIRFNSLTSHSWWRTAKGRYFSNAAGSLNGCQWPSRLRSSRRKLQCDDVRFLLVAVQAQPISVMHKFGLVDRI